MGTCVFVCSGLSFVLVLVDWPVPNVNYQKKFVLFFLLLLLPFLAVFIAVWRSVIAWMVIMLLSMFAFICLLILVCEHFSKWFAPNFLLLFLLLPLEKRPHVFWMGHVYIYQAIKYNRRTLNANPLHMVPCSISNLILNQHRSNQVGLFAKQIDWETATNDNDDDQTSKDERFINIYKFDNAFTIIIGWRLFFFFFCYWPSFTRKKTENSTTSIRRWFWYTSFSFLWIEKKT